MIENGDKKIVGDILPIVNCAKKIYLIWAHEWSSIWTIGSKIHDQKFSQSFDWRPGAKLILVSEPAELWRQGGNCQPSQILVRIYSIKNILYLIAPKIFRPSDGSEIRTLGWKSRAKKWSKIGTPRTLN